MDKNKDKNLYKRVAVAYYKISKSLFFRDKSEQVSEILKKKNNETKNNCDYWKMENTQYLYTQLHSLYNF